MAELKRQLEEAAGKQLVGDATELITLRKELAELVNRPNEPFFAYAMCIVPSGRLPRRRCWKRSVGPLICNWFNKQVSLLLLTHGTGAKKHNRTPRAADELDEARELLLRTNKNALDKLQEGKRRNLLPVASKRLRVAS